MSTIFKKHRQLIFIATYKIGGIDYFMPFLMECKRRYPAFSAFVIFPNKASYDEFVLNTTISGYFKDIDAKVMYFTRSDILYDIGVLFNLVFKMVGRRNIVYKIAETLPKYGLLIKVLRAISKINEITILAGSHTKNIYNNLLKMRELIAKRRNNLGSSVSPHKLLNHSEQTIIYENDLRFGSKNEYLRIGYVRRLKAWQDFVSFKEASFADSINSKYFFYVLSSMHKSIDVLDEPTGYDMLCETLDALKYFNDKLITVFKPAPITDMKMFKKAISRTGYSNYVISWEHPCIIAKKSEFVISNAYSTIQADAYYQRIPTIDYFHYDDELKAIYGNESCGADVIDFFIETPDKLKEVVNALIEGRVSIKRDATTLDQLFPPTSDRFWRNIEFLYNI